MRLKKCYVKTYLPVRCPSSLSALVFKEKILMKKPLLPVFCIFACLLFVGLGAPEADAKKFEQVTEIEGITEYRLKNGMKVLLFPDPSKETVTVNMTYKVGSRHESYGETGMAHLLEHLLFKGSKRHKDIPAEMSARGAESNGTTWVDRTNYFETFSASEENIEWALDLEADRMVNSFIAQDDLDSEMTVVRNEFERSENKPLRVLMQKMTASAYAWHNNGKPTIGARSDIENVSIDRLKVFYKRFYQPDNAVLTVSGKFEQDEMIKRIAKRFGKIPKPKRSLEKPYTVEPPQSGERSVVVRRVGDIQWYASAYHIPAGAHPDSAALDVLTQILSDSPRGRLYKELVEGKKAVSSFAYANQLHDPGLMFAFAKVEKGGDLERAREALLKVVEGVAEQPITQAELDTAKRAILSGYEMAFNSPQSIAIHLSEYIGMGDWRLLFLNRDRIEAVTLEDLQRVSSQYIRRNNRTEGRFLPTEKAERVEIPVVENVSEMLQGYQSEKKVVQGEAFDPSFANIDARTSIVDLKPLGPTAKAAFLEKKSRGEQVVVQLDLQFGSLPALKNKKVIGNMTGQMLMRGTQNLSREALENRLDELKTYMRVGGGVSNAYATLTTSKEFLLPALEVMADVLRNPAFNQDEFQLIKKNSLTSIESSKQKPAEVVSREMRRFYHPYESNHPRYNHSVEGALEAIADVELAEVRDFHERFYGAANLQIAVVGDFDKTEVQKHLEKLFAGWLSKEQYQRIPMPYQEIPVVDKTIDTPDKESSALVAMLPIPLGETDKEALALEVGAHLMGGGFLNSRLSNRLRGDEGLSYTVSAWAALSPYEARGSLSVYAIFAPQNTGAVRRAIVEEFERVIKEGFTPEELEEVKKGLVQKARVSRSEDSHLASRLTDNLRFERQMNWWAEREKELQALTVDELNRTFKHFVNPDALSFVVAGDQEKSE